MLFLFLYTLLQLETFDDQENFYVFFNSTEQTIVFSSYRLSNPDRIVIEINGTADKTADVSSETVLSVSSSEKNGTTRFIFTVKENTQYTVLNRKNALLVGFSTKLFVEDSTFDSVYALFQNSKAEKTKVELAKAETAKVEPKIDESVLVAELMQDLETEKENAEALKKEQIAKLERDRLAKLEQERLAKLELEKKAKAEAEAEEKEKLAKLERERLAKLEIEKSAAEAAEKERLTKLEQEKLAKLEQEKLAKLEQERLAKLEQERLAKLEQEKLAKLELERLAKLEQERIAKFELEEKAKAEAEAEEKEKLAKLERERLAKLDQERIAKLEKEKISVAVVEKTSPELKKSVKTEQGDILHLKVTKAEPEKKLSESLPDLPVKKLEKKGVLKNIYFRKFPEFSRVTMELTGETDYQFREIKGGYVIDVHNFEKIPKYLLNIIDTRGFEAEVEYIYPKKVGDILKIYIKTDAGMAVRKSEDKNLINFDFYKPTIQ